MNGIKKLIYFAIIFFCFLIFLTVISFYFFGTINSVGVADYYVDASSGSDNADGLSPQSAWQSLAKVNSTQFQPGSRILFKKGEVWRGQLKLASGSASKSIAYLSYGEAIEKPTILGSLNKSDVGDWVQEAENIWRSSSAFETDVGNLIFNKGGGIGGKKWDIASLTNQGDYWFDRSSKILRIYSVGNPATFYSDIECALRKHIINQDNTSYAIIDGLALKYGAAHGIGGANTHHISIRNMDISYIGGGDLRGDGSNVRYGNGIEFWGNAHDNLVEKSKIWEIYDTCLSNQNHTKKASQYNITYRNNVMWNCGLASFEFWNRPSSSVMRNIRFENNTAVNAGYGWGKTARPDRGGAHILSFQNEANTEDVIIRNNLFYGAVYAITVITDYDWATTGMEIDHNCYYQKQATDRMAHLNNGVGEGAGKNFTMKDFDLYKNYVRKDINSIVADPLFVNAPKLDFRLQEETSCINTGVGWEQ